ncbi:MAG: hypothetical protein LBR70_01540 [Lactobacillaceae bacterium]|nr:hypothetical protein [Lactobacillaceae bacterium]
MKSAKDVLLRKQVAKLERELPIIGVLGLPGIGKSETSKAISKILDREKLSVDPLLVMRLKTETGFTPKEYMDVYGEEAFRKWEKTALMNNFKVEQNSVLDFGGFGSFDIGYESLFDKMKENGVYTVFLDNDFGITISHLKKWNNEAVNPLTGEKGYHDWAVRPGYVAAALKGLEDGKNIDHGWMERHKNALARKDFIYKHASHTLDLGNIDWTAENVAKMVIMATAKNCLENTEQYKDLFNEWKQQISSQEKQVIGSVEKVLSSPAKNLAVSVTKTDIGRR